MPANVNSIVTLHIETFFGQDFNNIAEFRVQTRIGYKGICYSKYFTKNCNPPPVYTLVQTVSPSKELFSCETLEKQ